MTGALQGLHVPTSLHDRVSEMIALADSWCAARLDDEYAELTRRVVGRLARKQPPPLTRGEVRIWAAGTLYAVGQLNYLGDARHPPYLTADEVAALTGVPKSTLANKAKRVREIAGLRRFDPDVSRHDVATQCPDPFVAEVDGRIVDAAAVLATLARQGR